MAFEELIAMKKSSKLKSTDSFIKGMTLIFVYDCFCSEKVVPYDLEDKEFLIAPMIVNNKPWTKGYFEIVDNVPVSEREKKIKFGFWDVLTQRYVDIHGMKIKKKPKYCSIYGLGSCERKREWLVYNTAYNQFIACSRKNKRVWEYNDYILKDGIRWLLECWRYGNEKRRIKKSIKKDGSGAL